MLRDFYRPLLLAFLLIASVSATAYGSSYVLEGTVTASGVPVRNALVTVLDNTNASVSYTGYTDSTGKFEVGGITAVEQRIQAPAQFQLEQNYPNPFSSKTAISYNLNKQSNVKVTIYDVLGRVVKNFSMGDETAGVHGIIWNGLDNLGRRVAPGVYFYRLQARGQTEVRKMLFGVGGSNTAVSLSGVLPPPPSQSHLANDVVDRPWGFSVSIANTDSTDPLIVPQEFGFFNINSDTTMDFSVKKLAPAVVYGDSTQQEIEGFGGANTVNWQDHNFTSAEINEAFGDGPGDIGLTIMRLRIPPDSSQFIWSVPSAKQAESLGAKVIASPWTPPTWMKTNHNIAGGYLDTNDYAAYAAHLAAFADTLAANGAPIYAISVQNEPDAHVNYESCFWTATDIFNFMRYDAPKVGVPVFMPESESFIRSLSDSTLNDSLACAHTAFVGGHLYGANPYVYSLALSKGKQVWMTEYLANDTTWTSDLSTAKQVNDCMYDDMSAYVWWWTIDGWSLVSPTGSVAKRGYAMSQYARFVRPGDYRITATENPQPDVYMTAYEGNGKTVVVIINMNSNSTAQQIDLKNLSVTSFTPYVTSSTQNCVQGSSVPVSNGTFTARLAPSSVETFVSN